MDRKTLEWYEILSKGLIWAAGVVLVLALIGAISIATSSNSLPFSEDVQREGRGIAAIGAIGAGLATSALLAGLGAILRLMLVEPLARARREQPLPGEAPAARAAAQDADAQPQSQGTRGEGVQDQGAG